MLGRLWSGFGLRLRVVLALVLLPVSMVFAVGAASPSSAAVTVDVGPIKARLKALTDMDNWNQDPCFKMNPVDPASGGYTAWVSAGAEVQVAHGTKDGYVCPPALNSDIQSTVGVVPSSSTLVTEGAPFVVARVKHYNRGPLWGTGRISSELQLQLGTETISYPWWLYETPNDINYCPTDQTACDDILTITVKESAKSFFLKGVEYKLVIEGFTKEDAQGVCGTTNLQEVFVSPENGLRTSCLMASLKRISPPPTYGQLTITPTITGAVAGAKPGTGFAVKAVCTAPVDSEGVDHTYQATVTAGQTWTSPSGELFNGTSCVVSQTPAVKASLVDDSFAWGTAPAAQTVAIKANETSAVTLTNPIERVYGALAIETVLKNAFGAKVTGTAFAGDWTCTYGTGAAASTVTGTWSRNGAGQATLAGASDKILVGSVCQVRQGTLSAPVPSDSSYVWLTPTFSPAETGVPAGRATVTLATPGRVVVTNEVAQNTTTLTLRPTVSGATDGVSATAAFTYQVACQAAGSFSRTIRVGEQAVLSGIPVNDTCAVTQGDAPALKDASYAWGTVGYSGVVLPARTVTLPGAGATVTINNPVDRVYGALLVRTVVKNSFGAKVTGTGFAGSWSCTYGAGASASTVSGLWSRDGEGLAVLSGAADKILVGSVCAVRQGALSAPVPGDSSYVWLAPVFDPVGSGSEVGQSTVTLDVPARVVVTNEVRQNTTTLTVRSTVRGEISGMPTGSGFTYSVVCRSAGTFSRTIAVGDQFVLSGIPVGDTCTVSQGAAPALKDASYAWGTPGYLGVSGVERSVTLPAAGSVVTVLNSIDRVLGTFALSEVLNDPFKVVESGRVFTGTWQCSYDGSQVASGSWSAKAGETLTLSTQIPVTSMCSAATQNPGTPSADPSYRWELAQVSGAVQVVGKDAARVTATHTVARDFGTLRVRTQVVGGGYERNADDFALSYRCSHAAGGAALEGTRTISTAVGFVVLSDKVPAGWECTVSPVAPAQELLADASFVWTGTTAAPAQVGVRAGAVADSVITHTTGRVAGKLELDKVASAINDLDGNGPDAGDTIAYSFTVKNTGTFPLSSLGVQDPLLPNATLTCFPAVINPGQSADCGAADYTITAADVAAGVVNNTATATANPAKGGAQVSATDSTSTPVVVVRVAGGGGMVLGNPPKGKTLPSTGAGTHLNLALYTGLGCLLLGALTLRRRPRT